MSRFKAMRFIAASASLVSVVGAALCGLSSPALAWGDTGHRLIGELAIETLPSDMPAFLRTPEAAADIGEWDREPDRWRGAGKVHDDMRDPGHFVDVGDDGTILGGPKLSALPPTREDYDVALIKAGTTMSKAGFLPYNIVDGYQQLTKDFAYWRADNYVATHESNLARKAWALRDLKRREWQTRFDIGVWGHYVGDGSQPMHASVHYNGWGEGPNPHGFTLEHVHVPFEGPFVRDHVTKAAVRAAMAPLKIPSTDIMAETERYLAADQAQVVPFYRLEKDGGLKASNTQMIGFATARVAAGAAELRDLIAKAWAASDKATIGYPPVTAADVEAGKVANAYELLRGLN